MGSTSKTTASISPVMAIWLGTFVAAGCNLLASAVEERQGDEKRRTRLIQSGLYVGVAGPLVGLALWKLFSLTLQEQHRLKSAGAGTSSLLSIILASVAGSSLLQTQAELEAVNLVIWLRVAGGVWSLAGRRGADLVAALAVAGTFHGVVHHQQLAPRALVRMTKQFLGTEQFDQLGGEGGTERRSLSKAGEIVARTFTGLFAYNYFLHLAAAMASFAVRWAGTQVVHGVQPTTLHPNFFRVLVRAVREATMLNSAVSASCALLYLGGPACVPLPLLLTEPRVRDTVYFLFVPWFAKYAIALAQSRTQGRVSNTRSRIVLGVLLLEKPLKTYLENHEGYSWMVSVAFGIAQRLAAAKLARW